jgi:hypothetical protein
MYIGTVPPENEFGRINWSEFSPDMKAKFLTLFGATTVPLLIQGADKAATRIPRIGICTVAAHRALS